MGLLDYLLGKGKKIPKIVQSGGKSLSIEEITPETLQTPRKTPQKKASPQSFEEADERLKFVKAVNALRSAAGLPPVETEKPAEQREEEQKKVGEEARKTEETVQEKAKEERREEQVKEPQKSVSESKGSTPPQQEKEPLVPEVHKTPQRQLPVLSETEIKKLVKVAMKKLERALMNKIEEDMRARGTKSFKELARARRRMKEYISSNVKELADVFADALKRGIDPREDTFIDELVERIYPQLVAQKASTREEKKEELRKREEKHEKKEEHPAGKKKEIEKKEEPESTDELRELLSDTETNDEDELLKLLEED